MSMPADSSNGGGPSALAQHSPGASTTASKRGLTGTCFDHQAILWDSMDEVVIYQDREHRLVWLNSLAWEMADRPADEVLGKPCFEVWHNRDKPCTDCPAAQARDSGQMARKELITPHGKIWLISAYPVCDADGAVEGVIEMSRNVTSRKRAEGELALSEARYRSLVENVPYGICIVSVPEGRFLFLNTESRRMFDYTDDEAHELTIWDVLVPEDHAVARKRIATRLNRRDPADSYVYTGRRKDGTAIRFEVTMTLVTFEGQPALQGIIKDVTEHEVLQSRVRQMEKIEAIGTLAGGIAHDFNNILSAIVTFADLACDSLDEQHKARDDMAEILRAADRAKNLVRQIMTFCHGAPRTRSKVDLAAAIQDALRLLRASLPANIELRQELALSSASVLADETQIYQVLLNLCTNAAQAMKGGGVLTVEVKPVNVGASNSSKWVGVPFGRYIALRIGDTGVGMECDVMQRIFDPFFTTKSRHEGTGLGLSVVHGIVKELGGSILVDSKPGEGSRFTVLWQRCAGATPSAVDHRSTEDRVNAEAHVLLVDDEEALVKAGTMVLKRMGYRVTGTQSGAVALDLFGQDPTSFDLVLTDQTMPGMTGVELARKLTALRVDIPVVLYTGYCAEPLEAEAKAAGVRALVMKPLVRRELAKILNEALGTNLAWASNEDAALSTKA